MSRQNSLQKCSRRLVSKSWTCCALGEKASAQELAVETDHNRKQVYRVIDDLLKTGLLDESRSHHNQRVVRATDDSVVEAYSYLTSKLGHVDWPELLLPVTHWSLVRLRGFTGTPLSAQCISM